MFRAAAVFAFVLAVVACGKSAPPPEKSPADGAYDANGVITGIDPASADGPARLSIDHEDIPAFADREGKKVGMKGMVMAFDVAPGVDVQSLAVGNKVRFHFEVRWSGGPMLLVTKVEKR